MDVENGSLTVRESLRPPGAVQYAWAHPDRGFLDVAWAGAGSNPGFGLMIQNEDSRGFHPRTFSIDPSGRLMVVANTTPMRLRLGEEVRRVPANLVLFRIDDEGRLHHASTFDIEPERGSPFWSGLVELPAR